MPTPTPQIQALRPAQAAQKLSIGLSTLWMKAKTENEFPKPVKAGPRTTIFFAHELDAYLSSLARTR